MTADRDAAVARVAELEEQLAAGEDARARYQAESEAAMERLRDQLARVKADNEAFQTYFDEEGEKWREERIRHKALQMKFEQYGPVVRENAELRARVAELEREAAASAARLDGQRLAYEWAASMRRG